MHVNSLLVLLIFLCVFTKQIYTSKILIFNPIFGFSHVKFISKLADIIADHGHNVTLFQPYHNAMKNIDGLVKNENIKILNYYPDHFEELKKEETQTFPIFWDSKLMNIPVLGAFVMPKVLGSAFQKTATQVLKDQTVLNELKNEKFDVMMAETFEITGIYLAHLLDIPCIPFMSAVRYPIFSQLFGQPSILGYVPHIGSQMAPEAGFYDRLNDVYRQFFMSITQERLNEFQNNVIEEAIGRPVPYWKDLVKQSPIYITNSNPYLDYAVPSTATIVHAGGITMDLEKKKKPQKLTEEYEQILTERESTVLISFGSVIRSYEMPETFKAGIIQMFENLPNVTFIWKYEKDDVEFEKTLPKNVHLKKWVPQPALLADKRLKVFVTHGGLGSIMELAYAGKPAIVVPIFGDQPHNAVMLERHGGAVAYDKFELQDGEKLTKVINDMMSNQRFPNHRSQVPSINEEGIISHYYLDAIAFLVAIFGVFAYIFVRLIQRLSAVFLVKKTKND
uniref:UDP-glucuronosyltransferase n=1 Tax=Caenorhabditis japonica TaxID=281687 RepID=A0A8R1HXJ2_CAEJA